MKIVFLLIIGLAVFACSPIVFGSEFRKSISGRQQDIAVPLSSDVAQSSKSPLQMLKVLLSTVGVLKHAGKRYPGGSNFYLKHCEKVISYERKIRNLFVSRIEKGLAKIRLLEKEKERCTRLLSLIENSSRAADIGNIASIDTQLHCKKLGVEVSHVKARFDTYRESLLRAQKILNLLTLCNKTVDDSHLQAISKSNILKNSDAMYSKTIQGIQLLYRSVNSTVQKAIKMPNRHIALKEKPKSFTEQVKEFSMLTRKRILPWQGSVAYTHVTKNLNASKLLKVKYLRLLADLSEEEVYIKRKMRLIPKQTKGQQSLPHSPRVDKAENRKDIKILIQLEAMSHLIRQKVRTISSEIASYQTELYHNKRAALALESAYLRNMSSLLHYVGSPPITIANKNNLENILSGLSKETNDTSKSVIDIANFDKRFANMLWQSLGQRQTKISTSLKKLSQHDAPTDPVGDVNISFSSKKAQLRVSSVVSQRAAHPRSLRQYFKNNILDNFGAMPYNLSRHGLLNRASSRKRSLFLNLLKIQQAALKARSNYLAYRTQYELAKTAKEINEFHKVLLRSSFAFLDPIVATVKIALTKTLSIEKTQLFVERIINKMLLVSNILSVHPETTRSGMLKLKIEFLNRNGVNSTLGEITDKLNETAKEVSGHGTLNGLEKDLVAHVYSIHVETAKKNGARDFNEFRHSEKKYKSLGKLNRLRSLYLKARLDALRFQPTVDLLAGFPSGVDRQSTAAGIETAMISNRFDESTTFRYNEVNASQHRNNIKASQSNIDTFGKSKTIQESADAQNIASRQGLLLVGVHNKLIKATKEMAKKLREKNEELKKFKQNAIELRQSLKIIRIRLGHRQRQKEDATTALYFRVNRTAQEVQYLKSKIFKIHANASERMKHYIQGALRIFKQSILNVRQRLNVTRSSQLFVENGIIQSLKKQLNSLHSSHSAEVDTLRERLMRKNALIFSVNKNLSMSAARYIHENRVLQFKHALEMKRVRNEVHTIKIHLKKTNQRYLNQLRSEFAAKLQKYKDSMVRFIHIYTKRRKHTTLNAPKDSATDLPEDSYSLPTVPVGSATSTGATGTAASTGATGTAASTGATGTTTPSSVGVELGVQKTSSEWNLTEVLALLPTEDNVERNNTPLMSLAKDMARIKSHLLECQYMLYLNGSQALRDWCENLKASDKRVSKMYEMENEIQTKSWKNRYENARRVVDMLVFKNKSILSTSAFINLEIRLAYLRKLIVDDSSKLHIALNRVKVAVPTDSSIAMAKAKLLRKSINISRARMKELNKKMVTLLDREGIRVRNFYDRIVQDAISKSEENIRLSDIAGKIARETSDFTTFNDEMHNVCRSDKVVLCGNSCCPERFPVCGGANDCPVGKCCSHKREHFALTRFHTNVSRLFGVKHFVRPALNFTMSNQNAYFRFIRTKLERLSNTLLLLNLAKNRINKTITRNEKIVANFRVSLKEDIKSVGIYKSLMAQGSKKIKGMKDKIKHEYHQSTDAFPAIFRAIRQNDDVSPFVNQFFRGRVSSYTIFLELRNLIERQKQLTLFVPKIDIMDQAKYLDAAFIISKDTRSNAKEILDAITNVQTNIDMLRVLEADAKRVQRNYPE